MTAEEARDRVTEARRALTCTARARWRTSRGGAMTACTDDERREAARRLRGQAKKLGPNMDAPEFAHYTADVIDVNECMTWYEMELRLADLIEPSIPKDPGKAGLACVDAFIREMRHSTEEERGEYSAMLKKMSVELHPVDRDALLALAEDVDGAADDSGGFEPLAGMLRDIARSIREALGVQDG